MAFEDFPKNFIILALFTIAIFSFGIGFAKLYGFGATHITDSYVDLTDIEIRLNQTNIQSNRSFNAFRGDQSPITAFGGLVITSIWGAAQSTMTAVTLFHTVFINLLHSVFGLPGIVTDVLISLLLISLIFAGWRMIKGVE